MNTFLRKTSRAACQTSNPKRQLSHGSLPGGFTIESLQNWAIHNFGDEGEPYTDLFSERISKECVEYLNNQQHPSSELMKCYFGSYHFLPERILLTTLFGKLTVPNVFSLDTEYG